MPRHSPETRRLLHCRSSPASHPGRRSDRRWTIAPCHSSTVADLRSWKRSPKITRQIVADGILVWIYSVLHLVQFQRVANDHKVLFRAVGSGVTGRAKHLGRSNTRDQTQHQNDNHHLEQRETAARFLSHKSANHLIPCSLRAGHHAMKCRPQIGMRPQRKRGSSGVTVGTVGATRAFRQRIGPRTDSGAKEGDLPRVKVDRSCLFASLHWRLRRNVLQRIRMATAHA